MCLSKLSNSKIVQFFKKNLFGFIFRFLANSPAPEQKQIYDKRLIYSLSKSKIPRPKQIKYIKKFLSKKELWMIRLCFLVIFLCLGFLGTKFYFSHIKTVPLAGGEYREGLIGSPKYINPLYALYSDVDSDISSLVFSSIVKRDKNGQLIFDLARDYEIRGNGREYIFKIKKDVKWHNGEALKVDDIIFTINTIKDVKFKSPLESSLRGVEVEKIDDETIKFILSEPYAGLLEILTFGIIPEGSWQQMSPSGAGLAELNLKPIGSGPFKFKSLIKDNKTGQIKSYTIVANDQYYGPKPNLQEITFKFFTSIEEVAPALKEGSIDGISYLPKQKEENSKFAGDQFNFHQLNFAELVGIFFNSENNPVLSEKKVRQALGLAINKNEIVNSVLGGQGRIADSPILPDSFAYYGGRPRFNTEEAAKLLTEAGWQTTEISVSDIKKAGADKNSPDQKIKEDAEIKLLMGAGKWRLKDGKYLLIKLTAVANRENEAITAAIKRYWETMGVKTAPEMIEATELRTNVIRPRNFEALLYGQLVGADPDCYVFWHSLGASEGGYNFSNYINKEVDKLLEDARVTLNLDVRKEKYKRFQEIITEDMPVIYLYSPFYTYVQSKKIKGFDVKNIYLPQDRFSNLSEWYVRTGKKLAW